ncbi:hypothetical protein N7492_006191 [Penicillium capsulatum]|uniref:DNA-directed RNA polymerase III subunit Rpc5 n=1 Tax=Penicillium capsulatum TaxID=69766 RepID=A0A9W9LMF5_9EURO|nr:hypothetical protein N7492_006191 [Penicillium capsulatum]KAJ6108843.1 hypothetical protein N7512_008680 [Penicillium capsulatum]
MASNDDDPVIASYDILLTDSEISRYVIQYMDRHESFPYNERRGQKPTTLRMKPGTGLVEVDIPINTRESYVVDRGLKYGEAMKKSRSARDGGAYGMAGGFTAGNLAAGGARVKSEKSEDIEVLDNKKMVDPSSLIRTQSLGGRIKPPEEGDPVYMLATFKGGKKRNPISLLSHKGSPRHLGNLHLSPVSAVVQLQAQLHHLDALDEMPKKGGPKNKKDDDERPAESEARAIDVKVKGAEDGGAMLAGNLDLLKRMQEEKWKTFEWVDAETEESWFTYENFMMHQNPKELPQLETTINSEAYLDGMSAPRIDPARPDLTGWAMKQNRQKQREAQSDSEDEG